MSYQHCIEGGDTAPTTQSGGGGRLVPLKTTIELSSDDAVLEVYVTIVPVKAASGALDLIRSTIPSDGGFDLQHLRRFAKSGEVPQHVQTALSDVGAPLARAHETEASKRLFLIIGPTISVSLEDLYQALASTIDPLSICCITVPLLAPTSQAQATLWTSRYWPTVYKKSNPFGPHPSIVSRAEDEIQENVDKWMDLAAKVAQQSRATGLGEAIGVAIIERRDGFIRLVAVAGDARWLDWQRDGRGNTTAHAVIRAIAMVAEGLKTKEDADAASVNADIFRDQPLQDIEQVQHQPSGGGYLCHDLEIYCTHEPCVMCSMAILHSRFGRVIFRQRMRQTGGLCADGELGHGLFWRKELNWTLLSWHWVTSEYIIIGANIHA